MLKKANFKCKECGKKFSDTTYESSIESECPSCGTWAYFEFKKLKPVVLKTKAQPKTLKIKFKVGDLVEHRIYFNGKYSKRSLSVDKIVSIKKNVIKLKENSLSFDQNGEEIDPQFFPSFTSRITKKK